MEPGTSREKRHGGGFLCLSGKIQGILWAEELINGDQKAH
jgi:hypothetical protein